MSTLKEAALEYAAYGWKIIPLKPRGKVPASSHGVKDATDDPAEIARVWEKADYNIGLAAGESGVIVLDFDTEGHAAGGKVLAKDFLESLRREHPTREAATGSGGVHLYYLMPGGTKLGNRSGELPRGVDVRGFGGYVVLPPSIHPSGERYTWLNGEPIADLPYTVRALIEKKPRAVHPLGVPPSPVDVGGSPYARAALEREAAAVARSPKGERNNTLNKAAFSIGQLVAGGEIPAEDAERELRAAALATGLPEREVDKTLASGFSAGEREPRTAPSKTIAIPSINLDQSPPGTLRLDPVEALQGEEYHDALLLADLVRSRYAYDLAAKRWMVYTGTHWEGDEAAPAALLPHTELARRYAEAALEHPENAAAFYDRARRLTRRNRAKHVMEIAKNLLAIPPARWDAPRHKIPCANGVVDLTTGELSEGNPRDYLTRYTKTEWRGLNAPAPRWEKFLDEIFAEDRELISYVQKLFGYALLGDPKEHLLLVLWGTGANGKDTLLKAISYAVGYSVADVVESSVLVEDRRSGASPELAKLRGLRIAWVNETRDGAKLNAAKVKHLTGGGRITARALYSDPVTWMPTHTVFLLTNHKPHADSDDPALWRRIVLIPFAQTFGTADHPADRGLDVKLAKEASGILAWLVRGAIKYLSDGLTAPTGVGEATRNYRAAEDTLAEFLEERTIPGGRVRISEIYRTYRAWCEDVGILRPMRRSALRDRIIAKGHSYKKLAGGYFFLGLSLHR